MIIDEKILKQEYLALRERALFAGESCMQINENRPGCPSKLEATAFLSTYQCASQLLLLSQLYEKYFGEDQEGIIIPSTELQKYVDSMSGLDSARRQG